MNKKLAIIVSGGGMTCSYSAGVITALAKEQHFRNPDIVIAGSGSTGTMSYYVAEQYDSILNIWNNLLATKKFINFFRFWRIIDIDYLIDVVFKKLDPLNTEKILNSKIDYLVAITNYKTGEIEYLSNRNGVNIFEAMRAAKAMPIAFGKRVEIDKQQYCDTFLSSAPNLHILKALELGATHIIVVDSNNSNWKGKFAFNIWLSFRNPIFKKNYRGLENKTRTMKIPDNINMIRIQPKIELSISTLDNNKNRLIDTSGLGYRDCQNSLELKEFLKEFAAKEQNQL